MGDDKNWLQKPISEEDGAWRRLEDGSVIAESGRPVFFSLERFKREICERDSCFVCGLPMPDEKSPAFNKEHVIPDWLLTHFRLHNEKFTMPNGGTAFYGRYTLPCCENCNSLLAESLEDKVSPYLKAGYRSLINHLRDQGEIARQRLCTWLSLIFVKTHLRDRSAVMHPDPRKGTGSVAEHFGYDWETFHHLHAIARSPLTGATVDPGVFGTLLVLPAETGGPVQGWHYLDDYEHRAMLVVVGDVAIVALLADSGHAEPYLRKCLSDTTQPYGLPDLIALLARAMLRNRFLMNRPRYHSLPDPKTRTYRIVARHPGPPFHRPPNERVFAAILEELLRKHDKLFSEDQIEQWLSKTGELLGYAPPPRWDIDERLPVVVLRHTPDGLPFDTPPCVIGGAVNAEDAVRLARETGFVVLGDAIAPPIPVAELSHPYARFHDTIVVRVLHDPNILTLRGDGPLDFQDRVAKIDLQPTDDRRRGPRAKH
jgi:hypothetical protein